MNIKINGPIVSKIENLLEEIEAKSNIENDYADVHDDVRIHIYYDDDGFVWDAIEGEYVIGSSEIAFDTMDEAEADAKRFIDSFEIIDKDVDVNPGEGEEI